jgi:hypothetical protein
MHIRKHRIASLAGACLALLAFVIFALQAAVSFGGYAGALLAAGILAGKAEGVVGSALVLFGSALGVIAIGSLFAVAGGALGTAAGAIVAQVLSRRRPSGQPESPTLAAAQGPEAPPVASSAHGAPGGSDTPGPRPGP